MTFIIDFFLYLTYNNGFLFELQNGSMITINVEILEQLKISITILWIMEGYFIKNKTGSCSLS